jgi:type IV secretory pathway TraG/TraD family ATPase VirD4
VSVCLALQDVAQIKDQDERSAILANCATLMCLPGGSPATAKLLGERLGERQESFHSTSRSPSAGFGGASMSSSTGMVPVLGSREITAPPFFAYGAVTHVSAPEVGITSRPMLTSFDEP